jgi:uncharacterized membrane protein
MQTNEAVASTSLLRTVARHWFPAAVVAVVLPFALHAAAVRQLWLDEILTYHVLKGGDLGDLWHRLATGTQSDPPLFYLAARASIALFGDTPLAFRLPSVLGILVAGLALYAFVARRCSLAYARLAFLLTLLPPLFEHFYNARPYGLWLACSALCLLCWQVAGDTAGWRRWAALVGLALCAAASVATHFYAVLLLAALGLAELFRAGWTRRLDVPVWLGLAVAGVPLVAFRPLIANARSFAAGSWAAPSLTDPYHGLLGVLKMLFADRLHTLVIAAAVLVLALFRLWQFVRPGDRTAKVGPRAPHWAAGIALAAIPVLGWLLALFWTNNYDIRYVLPAVCALAVLLPMAAHRVAGGRALPGHLLALVTAALLAHTYWDKVVCQSSLTLGTRVWPAVQEIDERTRDSGTFLVTSRLHMFVETKFYHPEVRVLFVCLDTHPSTNAVARRLRSLYPGILEPEDLQELDQFLVVGDPMVSGTRLVAMVLDKQVPYLPQPALSNGKAVYLINPREAAALQHADAADPLGR